MSPDSLLKRTLCTFYKFSGSTKYRMEMILLHSTVSQLRNNDLSNSEKVHMHTSVIWPRGVNIGNRPLIEAKMKGCQVRDWIVGERNMSFSRILYMTCVE